MRATALLIIAVLCSLAAAWITSPASSSGAGPALGRSLRLLGGGRAVEESGHCLRGFRKSTVTGLCVRKTVRWPTLNWN
jgi:hypothetical protein